MFTTVAEDTYMNYLYCDAGGKTVDLAIKDQNMMAHVCHYVMLHTAESIFVGNHNNKKQYGLKPGLCNRPLGPPLIFCYFPKIAKEHTVLFCFD
jgi:hypothetical protein